MLIDDVIGRFIDCETPLIATARLSGMMLDYEALLSGGVDGLRARIDAGAAANGENAFYAASRQALDLFCTCAEHLRSEALETAKTADGPAPPS